MRIKTDGEVIDYKPFCSLEEVGKFHVALKEFFEKHEEELDMRLLDALVAGLLTLQEEAIKYGVIKVSESDLIEDYLLKCASLGYLAAKYPEDLIRVRKGTSDLVDSEVDRVGG